MSVTRPQFDEITDYGYFSTNVWEDNRIETVDISYIECSFQTKYGEASFLYKDNRVHPHSDDVYDLLSTDDISHIKNQLKVVWLLTFSQ